MPSITVDETGISIQTLQENQDEYLTLLRGRLGEDLTGAAATADGQLAGVGAFKLVEVSEQVVNAFNVSRDRAEGTQLDDFYSPLDVRRLAGIRSMVTATLTGTVGTPIPLGSLVRSTGGDTFRTLTGVQIASGGTMVEMEAVEVGAIEVGAGELTDIVTNISGWDGATNTSAAVIGRADETDDEYRLSGAIRAAHSAIGPEDAIRGALYEAGVERLNLQVHHSPTSTTIQNWFVLPHGILAVVQGGTDAAVGRTMRTHRGLGVPYMTAIVGGAPNLTALDAISSGAFSFGGTDYTGLDLTGANTAGAKATAISTLLGDAATVHWDGFRFVAVYRWAPGTAPAFNDNAVTQGFGFDPDNATASPGPFVRPIARTVAVTASVEQRSRFPSDGFGRIRNAVVAAVEGYTIGETPWLGDVQAAIENVPGTRASSVTMQSDSTDISDVEPDLATLWEIAVGDVTIVFT